MSPFKKRVISIVRMVPEGKVVSYGQVALSVGLPRAARQVGWILNGTEGKVDLPWWRVINYKGLITISGTKFNDRNLQKKLLEAEGILVSKDFMVDIDQYRYRPSEKELKKLQLSHAYIQKIIETYGV